MRAKLSPRKESGEGKGIQAHLVILRHFLLQYTLRILVRLTGVNSEGFIQPHSTTQLSCKDGLLDRPGRVVVVVIKSHLTPADASGMGHRLDAVGQASAIAARTGTKTYISASTASV